jgi:hypothetical protein
MEPFLKVFRAGYAKANIGNGRMTLDSMYNTRFIVCDESKGPDSIFQEHPMDTFSFHNRSTFIVALHFMVWCGFKKILLAGVDLDNTARDYSHSMELSPEHNARNALGMSNQFKFLEACVGIAPKYKVQFVSVSPNSKINNIMEYSDLSVALDAIHIPNPRKATHVKELKPC